MSSNSFPKYFYNLLIIDHLEKYSEEKAMGVSTKDFLEK